MIKRCPLFVSTIALLLLMAALQVALPDRARSGMENRPLRQLVPPRVETVLSGSWMREMEDYVSDQFPGRDAWMLLQAAWDAALFKRERGGVLIGKQGWLFEACADLSWRTAEASLLALDKLAGEAQIPFWLMLAPLPSAVYPSMLPDGYRPDDLEAALLRLYGVAGHLEIIDVLPALREAADSVQQFYQTDHHWTQDGMMTAYRAWLRAVGLEESGAEETVLSADGFYGTYFARAPSPLARPDTFRFAAPEGLRLSIEGEAKAELLDPAWQLARDKYAAILWGNHGRITLENGEADGVLLVIKDSYANPMLPQLAKHYGRVEAVDPRYYAGDLRELIEEMEADAVLCIYGVTTWLADRSLLLRVSE